MHAGGAEEVDRAVRAARAAFPAWAALPVAERSAILRRVADGVQARVEDLSRVETRDNGSLIRSHRRGVMPRVAMNFGFFADYAEKELGHPDLEVRGHRERVSYDPAGVVAIITPWNAPLMLATWRIGPALAAGNTVVLKPPEWAPLTASLLADIMAEAGVPAGVFNVVQGTGLAAGAPLTAHPGINRLSFTGSVPTAGVIAAAAAPNIVPLSFELGGKSPLVVFDDADLDLAVNLAVEQFDNAGQVCLGAFRILVHESVAEEFTRASGRAGPHDRPGRPARRGHRRVCPRSRDRTSSGCAASWSGRSPTGPGPSSEGAPTRSWAVSTSPPPSWSTPSPAVRS